MSMNGCPFTKQAVPSPLHFFVACAAIIAAIVAPAPVASMCASAAEESDELPSRAFEDVRHPARLRSCRVQTYNLSTPEKHRLKAGARLTLLDVKGSGQVVRLHISFGLKTSPRDVLLKMYWDGEQNPSVLCPVADFFCDPFGPVDSLQFATPYFGNASRHWYCYLPMPFSTAARIEVENQGTADDNIVAYDATVEEWEHCPADLGRFHACWRRENPTEPGGRYTVLDVQGRGNFIGCSLAVQGYESTLSYLEGFPWIYVDDAKEPALKYWGTEDFFGGSHYFCRGPSAGPYSGATLVNKSQGRFAGYRLFIKDAIPFQKGITVQLAHGAFFDGGKMMSYSGRADYASVAYWYQVEPHDASFYQGHTVEERRLHPLPVPPSKAGQGTPAK